MPPKKSALPIIVIAVVAVVIVAAVLGLLLLGGGGGGASSPEGAFRDFVSASNSQDIDGMIDSDIASFLPDDEIDDIKDDYSDSLSEEEFTVKIDSVEEIPKTDLSDSKKENINEMIDNLEEKLDVTVDDWAVLEYEITIEDSEGDEIDSYTDDDWVVVKIDGKWYNTMFEVGMDDGGDTTTPVGQISSMSVTSPYNATITFGMFSPTVEPMDARVILTPTTGDIIMLSFPGSLTAMDTGLISSQPGVTATYTDLNYAGNTINSGDFIKVYGLEPSTTYTVSIFYIPTDSTISLAGPTTFHTPSP
jgi:hypothetical protein